ncbi:protein canopy homolog 3 isoform X1 [Daphnia magna]|uniref:DUF3456 domain-containing protein n=1 Tax=Daphnia magna TaxID=35525 RepID=A0ABR0A508_9CRUS|nr:protein canopy homolog 3 isoform X1 [Daphnia magna]KAK4020217.1 hypothetical protein OUZ56_002214 [Daphnia magna]
MNFYWKYASLIGFCVFSLASSEDVKYATPCEVCKIVTSELEGRLKETGKSHDLIETGYSIDAKKGKKKYQTSELRLVESLEGLCERILDYRIHKERTDSSRFSKEMSQTFKTLHGLVAKGVKVDLGIPHEMWDKPPAEVTQLKTQCEYLLEDNEDRIEDWYAHQQSNTDLQNYLCRQHVLSKNQQSCLDEKGERAINVEL